MDWAVSLLRGPLDLRMETASTREWSPSLIRRLFTWVGTVAVLIPWVGTVAVLIPRRDAILVVECPSVGASMTSISRGVSRESRLSTSGRLPDPGFSRPIPSACWPRSEPAGDVRPFYGERLAQIHVHVHRHAVTLVQAIHEVP